MRMAIVEKENADWAKTNEVTRVIPSKLFIPTVQEVIEEVALSIESLGHCLQNQGNFVARSNCQHRVHAYELQILKTFDCLTSEQYSHTHAFFSSRFSSSHFGLRAVLDQVKGLEITRKSRTGFVLNLQLLLASMNPGSAASSVKRDSEGASKLSPPLGFAEW